MVGYRRVDWSIGPLPSLKGSAVLNPFFGGGLEWRYSGLIRLCALGACTRGPYNLLLNQGKEHWGYYRGV